MFDDFSSRSKQIVFAARLKAGERGASMIDTDDFLVGLVLEDQGMLEKEFFSSIFEGQGTPVNKAQSHIPFFSEKVAEGLLVNLKKTFHGRDPLLLTQKCPYQLPSNAYSIQRKPFRLSFNTAKSNLCICWQPSLQKRPANP